MANHTSTIDKVIEYLTNSFDPAAAGEIDARIELRMNEESIYFVIQDKKMRMGEQEKSPEITLFFESSDLAYEIFTGTTEMVNAFMNGHFKSDSNLIWVFHILGAFRKSYPLFWLRNSSISQPEIAVLGGVWGRLSLLNHFASAISPG